MKCSQLGLLLALSFQCGMARIQAEVALNDSFVLYRNFTNFYIQPDELHSFKLDEFFRGNFLEYSTIAHVVDDNRFFYNPSMIQVTPPIDELVREDFPQSDVQMSLPQTSIIYTEPYSNAKYFIFIDFEMTLYIYDIGLYFRYTDFTINDQKKLTLTSKTSLFSPLYINSTARTCNNLIILKKGQLLMNCLGEGWMHLAVIVTIDLSDPTKPKASYVKTSWDFQKIRDGKLILLQKMPNDEGNMILLKENKTTCYIDVLYFDGKSEPKQVRRISFFNEPPVPADWIARYDQDMFPDIASCESQYPSNGTIDELRVDIPFLQIQDMEVVHFHENVTCFTDMNIGLLFVELHCPNVTYCKYAPIAVIKEPKLGEIAIMHQEGLITEKTIFVQKISPPWVLEIQHENRNSPSIRRIYTVQGDEGQYVSFSIVDANQDYVLVHLISTQLLKPVFRVYKRSKSFLSVGHAEVTYTEFMDPGVFLQFISVSDNYLLLKTSDYFSVVRVWSQNMIFNVSDYEGLAMLDIFDKTIRVRILVSNMIHETIEATFEVMVLSRGKGMQVMRKYEGEWRDEPIIYFYNCGEPALRISIDELFEGTKDVPLQMIDLNEGELNGLFEASKPSILPLVDGEVVQKNCQIKTVVENSPNQKVPKILFCIKFGGDEITLVDLNSPQKPSIQNLTIKSAMIIDKIYNKNLQETYLLSNSTSTGAPGAIVHALKFYNLLAWENCFDLNIIYKELEGQFRFRNRQPQTFNELIEMGVLIGEEREVSGLRVNTILIYDLDKGSRISNLRVIAKHDIYLDKDDKVTLSNIYIDRFANIWAVLSNQTLNMYAMAPHPPRYEESTIQLENLFLKKSFYFGADPLLTGKHFLSFALFIDVATPDIGDKAVLFFGNSTMAVYRYVRGSADIKRLMIFPLYYGDLDDDIENAITYQFVVSNDVVYARYQDELMLILLKRFSGKTQIGYSLFLYDIRRNKLGSLLMKVYLGPDLEVKEDFVKVEIIANDDESDIKVYLFAGEERLVQYSMMYKNEIQISNQDRNILTRHCQVKNTDLHYEIYPQTNKDQKAHIVVRALNTGLAIINKKSEDSISITNKVDFMKTGSQAKASTQMASYSLGRLFQGHNQSFTLDCPSPDSRSTSCADIAKMHRQSVTLSKDIEILSSVQKLLAFFVHEPAFLFIHEKNMQIYFPDRDVYYHYDLSKLEAFKTGLPNKYFFKTFKDVQNNLVKFMMYQTNDQLMGISLWFTSTTFKGVSQKLVGNPNFESFSDELFFGKPDTLLQVPWSILEVEVQVFNSQVPITLDEALSTRLVLASYDPQILFNSVVKFFDIDFSPPNFNPVYKEQSAKIISCNRLNLDSFTINSIILVGGNSTLLAIGVQDYGVIIFDIVTFQIVKLVSLQEVYLHSAASRSIAGSLFINAIVTQENQLMMFAIVNNNAVFAIRALGPNFDVASLAAENAYIENSIPPSTIQESAHNSQGFVFLQENSVSTFTSQVQETTDPNATAQIYTKQNPSLKFFSFFSDGNSKGVGEMNLEKNEDCKYLQTIPYSMLMQPGFVNYQKASQDPIESFNTDQMITASICGGTSLKVRAFDLHPDLLLNRTFIRDLMVSSEQSSQAIVITSNNAYVNSTSFTLYLSIADSIRNESGTINLVMVALFFAIFPLLLIGLVMLLNRKAKKAKDGEKIHRQDSLSNSSDLTSNEASSSYKIDESMKHKYSVSTGQTNSSAQFYNTSIIAPPPIRILEQELQAVANNDSPNHIPEQPSRYEVSYAHLSAQSRITGISAQQQEGRTYMFAPSVPSEQSQIVRLERPVYEE